MSKLPGRPHFKHLATLPAGYDERTQVAVTDWGTLVIAHPEQPVRYLDGKHWLQTLSLGPDFA